MPNPDASVCNVKVSVSDGIINDTLSHRLTFSLLKALSMSTVQTTAFGAETDVDGVNSADMSAY